MVAPDRTGMVFLILNENLHTTCVGKIHPVLYNRVTCITILTSETEVQGHGLLPSYERMIIMMKSLGQPDERTYTVPEIAQILKISTRKAYELCNTTKDFQVIRLGRSIRIKKSSFDIWFDRSGED